MTSVRTVTLAAVALGFALAALPATSRADLYSQTSDHCTGNCGTVAGNTVTVTTTAVANQLLITAQLANNWNFISSGAGGGASFGFSLPQASLTFAAVNPAVWTATTWEPFPTGGPFTSPQLVNGLVGGNQMDGIQFPSNFYGMTWNGGNGAAGQDGSTLSFTITAAGLTLSSFLAGTGGAIFAADVINHNNGNTGIIDFTLNTSVIPLPPAALLFGSALVGLGFLSRRRRNQRVNATA